MKKLNEKTKTVLSFIFRFGLSFLLLLYLFTKIDIDKTREVLKTADLLYVFFAFCVFVLIMGILLYRWLVFIRALDLTVHTITVVRYFFIGLFGNLFLPSAIGGDLIKILGLCSESTEKAKVVASVLLDRLSGFAAIALVAISAFVLGYGYINEKSLIIPIGCMAFVACIAILVLFNQSIYHFCCRIFNKLPKIKNGLMNMHDDIMLLHDKRMEGYKAIAVSCGSQLILAVSFYLVAKALHQNIDLIYFLIFIPLICVASSFPSIGGLGVREAGAVYLFGKIGVDSGIAVSIALINFSFMVIVGLLGGLIYVSTLSARRLQHHPSDAGLEPEKT